MLAALLYGQEDLRLVGYDPTPDAGEVVIQVERRLPAARIWCGVGVVMLRCYGLLPCSGMRQLGGLWQWERSEELAGGRSGCS